MRQRQVLARSSTSASTSTINAEGTTRSSRSKKKATASSSATSTPSSNPTKIPAEVQNFFHEHKTNLTESTFRSFCESHLNETIGGVPPGLPKHYWKTLLKENPGVSRRIGKKRTKRNVVNKNVVKINVEREGRVGKIVGISGVPGAQGDGGEDQKEEKEMEEEEGGDEEGEEEDVTPAISDELLLDLNTCDNSTRKSSLLRMPSISPLPETYTLAAQQFPPDLLHRGDIPDQISLDSPNPDTIFYFRYIRNTLQTLLRLRQKFLQPSWAPEIKEGWYDSNLWPYFIDYLFSRSSTLSLLRKELAIIPGQSERDRYDGVFRCIKRGFRFDLGVIEVSRLSDRPNSDMKATIDRGKIVRALQSLLGWARKRIEDEGLQVVGVLCSGWSVTLFRMSYDAELKYIVDQQHFAIEWDKDFHENLEIMEALVRHVEIMEQTAAVIVSKGRMLR